MSSSEDLAKLLGVDLSLLDEAYESWERKGPLPVPALTPAAEAEAPQSSAEVEAAEVSVTLPEASAPVPVTGPRPESATSAWIEHCKQLEAQAQLSSSKHDSFSSSVSRDSTGSNSVKVTAPPAPPPPPPPPPPQLLSTPQPQKQPNAVIGSEKYNMSAPAANEELSLQDILDELAGLYECANMGLYYSEARLEHLVRLQEANPEYQEQVAAEQEAWRCSVDSFLCDSLIRMRSYIPPDIFSTTLEALLHLGLTPELAKRVLGKRSLWLTRMSSDEIARLHEADLNGRFNYSGETLDLVELAAIYASLPDRFVNDKMGKKAEWRDGIERTLREWLGTDEDAGVVPEGRARHEMYEAFLDDTGPCSDTTTVREINIVSSAGSQGPRNSFQEVCRRHSLLSRRRLSSGSGSETSSSTCATPESPYWPKKEKE